MANNGRVIARCASECTTVTNFFFNIADDGTFGALTDGEDIANGECGLLSAVDEGAGVETLSGDESLFSKFVAVWVTENDSGKGSASEIRKD